jgi:hypothetical protein
MLPVALTVAVSVPFDNVALRCDAGFGVVLRWQAANTSVRTEKKTTLDREEGIRMFYDTPNVLIAFTDIYCQHMDIRDQTRNDSSFCE